MYILSNGSNQGGILFPGEGLARPVLSGSDQVFRAELCA